MKALEFCFSVGKGKSEIHLFSLIFSNSVLIIQKCFSTEGFLFKPIMNPSEDEVHEALFAAAEHGRSDVIKALLEHTTGYMNVRDIVHERTGETPLQMAIQNGKIDAVRVLLAAGFPLGEKVENIVDLKDLEKEKVATYSAYAIACEQQQPKMMNVFHQFFIQKVAEDDIDAVRRLLNAGIDVTIIGEDTSANSIYHWAAMCGSSETLAILLDTDLDKKLLNRPNNQGATPLSEAVRLDHYECVKILLANGAESSSVCSTSAKTIAQSERMQRLFSQHTKIPDQNQKFDSNIITEEEHVKQEVVISDVLNYATELEEKNLLVVQLKSTIERLVAELQDLKSLGREMSVLEYIRKLRKVMYVRAIFIFAEMLCRKRNG